MKRSTLLRTVITLIFITLLYLSFRGELGEILQVLKGISPSYFLFCFLLQILVIGLISARLKLIFKSQGLILSLTEVVELSFLGIFFNNFLPTAAGGDLPKAFYAYKKTKKKIASFACVVGDRIIGLFTLVLMAFIGILLLWQELNRSIKVAVSSLFLVGSFLLLFLFNHRMAKSIKFLFSPLKKFGLEKKIEAIYDFLHTMSKNKKLLCQALFLSIAAQTLGVVSAFMLIQGLSVSESFLKLFVILPLIVTLSMLPSLNGLGIREGAFVYFLGGTIGKRSALAFSLLWLALLGMQSLIGGIYYLFQGRRQVPLAQLTEYSVISKEENR